MEKNFLIFLPDCLEFKKTGYIRGIHSSFPDCDAFYITSNEVFNNYGSECIGFIGTRPKSKNIKNVLCLNFVNDNIIIDNKIMNSNSVIQIIYDYNGFKNSNIQNFHSNYGRHFQILSNILKRTEDNIQNDKKTVWKFIMLAVVHLLGIILWVLTNLQSACSCSATFEHLKETITSLQISLKDLYKQGSNPILCNTFSAILIDMILGILALRYFLNYEDYIVDALQVFIEKIISNLEDLLRYLMGSPIGLKLNYAFNKSLGQFFFYHISLWKIFLLSLRPFSTTYFSYFMLPGALGLSFQIAMISDIISIATFHVYCIYVYAARLFNLQLRALISLWRLFLGRKYNPLRDRVDSCQYSPNQLFIGTLVFTVLLFLLPTTVMYYTVFSMFRLVTLTVDGILMRSRSLLKAIPLFILVLWIKRSPSLAGSVCMDWQNCHEDTAAKIKVKLKILQLMQCISSSMPNKSDIPIRLGSIFHSVFTGALL